MKGSGGDTGSSCFGSAAFSHEKDASLWILAQRIGALREPRAFGTSALEAAAGRLIDRYPNCPRHASQLMDRLTIARDLAVVERRP
jgi:hypothetical protein